jgi:hypothetical protein
MKISLGKVFEEDLPEWERVFSEVLHDIKETISLVMPQNTTEEVVTMIKYLCSPDPQKRGYPKNMDESNYNLEHFISRLDLLAKEAELGII